MSDISTSLISKLPDIYSKGPDSNNSKIFEIFAAELDELHTALIDIERFRDIDDASGYTLDRIGKNVEQYRGTAEDNVFRILIKAKIKRNLSDGSIDTIIDILGFILNIPAEEVSVTELWEEGEPAAIKVDVSTEAVNSTGLTLSQFGQLVDLIVAGGVKASVFFEGTFQFSSNLSNSEMDTDAGFSDEFQVIGGYFGAIYDPGNDQLLPF
jgi:hypothetical protein